MDNRQFQNSTVRTAEFAGKFYPGTKDTLKHELEELFMHAKETTNKNLPLRALIAPHAGYVFSGKVAASAYNQIPDNANYKRIFILASSHQYHFRGAALFTNGNYATPLGEIKTDTDTTEKLLNASTMFLSKPEAHNFEHSLEVQLPFLQQKLGNDFLLVPIVLGTNNANDCKKIADVLKPWFTEENLFVISTDFSHYPEYNDACNVDRKTARAISENQPSKLIDVLEENKKLNINNLATSLCGWTSVLTLLYLTEKEKVRFELIEYQNSGDAKPYGEKNRVVGYWAMSVMNETDAFTLNEKEKQELLTKARSAVSNYLQTGKKGKIIPTNSKGALNDIAGVFVSIYVHSELRGCMGSFAKEKTLNELVQQMAVSAANDYRFENLKTDELEEAEFEISVLTPLKKIKSPGEIVLGKHGIYIKKDYHSGTFLPQVAKKTQWTVNEFLGHCSRDKAGIGWEGWKIAELFTYEAYVFRGI